MKINNQPVQLRVGASTFSYFPLSHAGVGEGIHRLPFSLKILLENLLRHEDGVNVTKDDVHALSTWDPKKASDREILFTPCRVILQDFTGVPCVVDLASLRDRVAELGGNPERVNPLQQVDLVIDHSVQVDSFGEASSFSKNVMLEYDRNKERYSFLKWGQNAFQNFRVVPPGTGIVHQVNLEYLGQIVYRKTDDGLDLIYPDTLIGTDSHTTMINALGILGWGVGGIEAEAAMLGQPISMLIPEVIGFKLKGKLVEGVTATDLVLTITQILRKKGVVGKFVEFFGVGLSSLTLPDRATIANMAPEYGATVGFFPVDEETLNYLKLTGRPQDLIDRAKAYCQAQGLFRTDQTPDPVFSDVLELDLASIKPSVAGPRRPHDRVELKDSPKSFADALPTLRKGGTAASSKPGKLEEGAIVISAITSCTNTSNPSVLIEAGLLAQNAVKKGLKTKPWVKTSLAPGSKVVVDYLQAADLLGPLEKLGFYVVGFGCTTCIGNSGPLSAEIEKEIKDREMVVVSALSGNRNFEGRIHPLVRANYLMSPPLVVAYALAGTIQKNLTTDALGNDEKGNPVYLADIWPSSVQVKDAVGKFVRAEFFKQQYGHVFEGDASWKGISSSTGERFGWGKDSSYIRRAHFLEHVTKEKPALPALKGLRVLALLGDSVTTDHISPAGSIAEDSPAGTYLKGLGVTKGEFNSYGARRGNHEVMLRGTFANTRLKNKLAEGKEGGWTKKFPEGNVPTIYEASLAYQKEKTSLLVVAGKEYGSGSSRDWAAKGTMMLGVKVVLAESYERIHRSNLVMMGVLPLQFKAGENAESLGMTGHEVFDVAFSADPSAREIAVTVREGSKEKIFKAIVRIDTPKEWEYFSHGGILPFVMREILKGQALLSPALSIDETWRGSPSSKAPSPRCLSGEGRGEAPLELKRRVLLEVHVNYENIITGKYKVNRRSLPHDPTGQAGGASIGHASDGSEK